ncbi:NAD-dependent deacetylase [Bacteroides coprosuis DSM 18011]|uniref:NAD-dependent protein deacylase n=1 Tax=Bacteroides coprosuis DSM 18011 TaxID=679937 RepID=F3ZR83_9BACE|nr:MULTISPECIES: Sir2 family NAD-dependent protein deacetylase [Bacteroides]EGJ70676.1 NAD-dependent deacetylase [Bacteroides coprosuis DSM 18011]HJD91053.1 NAD-dependent protein deacylase [Bacteroides coprosuis]
MKKKVVVLTGAGMSAESGIATFRGAGGLWGKYPVQQVASIEGYHQDPELVQNFYNERRRELMDVKPNKGHELLAKMEEDYDMTIITQNVDNLHERAGSNRIIHLHGELIKGCSSRNPYDPRFIVEIKPGEEIKMGDLAGDGSQLRPFIVWFGEAVPEIETALPYVREADYFVIIGTSMNVYPAAGLLHYVSYGTPIYVIDPNSVNVSDTKGMTHIHKGASQGVAELIELLRK